VKCTSSAAEGEVTDPEKGAGKITKLTFSSCSSPFCFGSLTATTNAAASNWTVAISTTEEKENTNGIMTVASGTGPFFCSFPEIDCNYSISNAKAHIDGSDTAPKMTATNVLLTKTSGPDFTCGTAGDWSGTYNITTPSSIFIE
jgi:hypothetical protein